MKSKCSPSGGCNIHPRLRVFCGQAIAFGPGKADLLEALHHTGSITKAAKRMGMSYMRAWILIRTMNRNFNEPLVVASRGGVEGGGGAALTDLGRETLALYRRMERKCVSIVQSDWKKFRKLCTKRKGSRK
jgi:molybdate transport system regulatory protein